MLRGASKAPRGSSSGNPKEYKFSGAGESKGDPELFGDGESKPQGPVGGGGSGYKGNPKSFGPVEDRIFLGAGESKGEGSNSKTNSKGAVLPLAASAKAAKSLSDIQKGRYLPPSMKLAMKALRKPLARKSDGGDSRFLFEEKLKFAIKELRGSSDEELLSFEKKLQATIKALKFSIKWDDLPFDEKLRILEARKLLPYTEIKKIIHNPELLSSEETLQVKIKELKVFNKMG